MRHYEQALLPRGWQLKPLGDLIDIRNGYAFKSADYTDSGTLLVRQSNLSSNGINTDNAVYLSKSCLKECPKYTIKKDDVLIGMSGSVGKLCIYDLDMPALQNQRTGLIEFHTHQYKEYATYYLQYIENELQSMAKGEAIKNISSEQIRSCLIPLPPADVAERIVKMITPLFIELKSSTQKLDTALKRINDYCRAVLREAFSGTSIVKRVKLSQLAEIRNGYNFPVRYSKITTESAPLFKVADLALADGYGNQYISDSKYYVSDSDHKRRKTKLFKPGFIVFAKTGEAIKLNRRAILAQTALIDNNMMGVLSSSPRLNNMYLYYFLLSVNLEDLGRATTVPSVRKSDVAHISIPLPPVSEQQIIVDKIDGQFASACTLEKAINNGIKQAHQLRQSMFEKAFAGKLVEN